jgi:Ala-tRNA(Pro) deacylase
MITEVNLTEAVEEGMYDRLIALLVEGRARYRLIDHEPEGQTVRASELRGHALSQAAKCIIVR